MTNSMIPYSFIPGTKAKANEVNANFISLANIIEQNKNSTSQSIQDINDNISEIDTRKANRIELITDFTVEEYDTNLNDYKTTGTYIFSSNFTPENIPKGTSGTLKVFGNEESSIKQIWFCNDQSKEIFSRDFQNSEWSDWTSTMGTITTNTLGYWKFPNGLLIQWGFGSDKRVTYPLAYQELACPVFMKYGYGSNYRDGDTGFTEQTLTGFAMDTIGRYFDINWIAIGY